MIKRMSLSARRRKLTLRRIRLFKDLNNLLSPPTDSSQGYKGMKIYSREGTLAGRATGMQYACKLEGCRANRIETIWPDGQRTLPCRKGLRTHQDGLRIE